MKKDRLATQHLAISHYSLLLKKLYQNPEVRILSVQYAGRKRLRDGQNLTGICMSSVRRAM
ncbi:hypothetical protein [Ethanoligenens sp.]|uniref:hypothetical protein n=1 Tax=Ethanoligenens sp. TaxID=2099655 RepID=UPI0039EB9740